MHSAWLRGFLMQDNAWALCIGIVDEFSDVSYSIPRKWNFSTNMWHFFLDNLNPAWIRQSSTNENISRCSFIPNCFFVNSRMSSMYMTRKDSMYSGTPFFPGVRLCFAHHVLNLSLVNVTLVLQQAKNGEFEIPWGSLVCRNGQRGSSGLWKFVYDLELWARFSALNMP